MHSTSPLAIPDRVEEANRAFLDTRHSITPRIVAGDPGLETAEALREATDRWIKLLWREALAEDVRNRVSLYATGGYGRDELAFHSDVDVLVAVDDPEIVDDADFALAIERLMAWSRQTRVSISHAVRTPEQARTALDRDPRTAISLLDLRHLEGPEATDPMFDRDRIVELLRGDDAGRSFVGRLVESMRRRAEKNGQTVYLLEPDVKSGEGGLRDLNCLGWAARVRWKLDARRDTDDGVDWTDGERADYRRRLDGLLVLRNRLHLLRDRPHDRLNFREQEALVHLTAADRPEGPDEVEQHLEDALAEADAPSAPDGTLHERIEAMMRDYYRRARAIATTSERLLRHWATAPDERPRRQGSFEIRGDRIGLVDGESLTDAGVFEVLEIAGRRDLVLEPRLEARIEDRVSGWPTGDDVPDELADRLRGLLLDLDQPDRTSRRLLHLGVLPAIVPEFEPLICHVHHDLYHVYTTDVHSRKCLEAGRRLLATDPEDHPRPSFCRIAGEIRDPVPFLLACLFHDVGKNRGEDHSELGASMMADVGPRLGLNAEETDRLQALVRHHLDLSTASRRRDISDPEIIDEFVELLGSVECLHQLTALTFCDMSTVGPDVMNDWNASLLLELHGRIREALVTSERAEPPTGTAELVESASAVDRLREALAGDSAIDDDEIAAFVEDVPDDHLADMRPEAMIRQFETYRRALDADDDVAVRSTPLPDRSVTEVVVSSSDRPGTLARLSGAIASVGLNIMTADIVTTDSGRALDIFRIAHFNPRAVPPTPPRPVDVPRRLERLETRIADVLCDRVDVDEILNRRRDEQRLAPRPVPSVGTGVEVDDRASSRFTVLEVRAPDRLGLLYSIARTLHECRVDTRVSRVDSVGHQAIDTFYAAEFDGTPLSEERTREVVDALEAVLRSDE